LENLLKKINRRNFIKGLGIAAAGSFLASCKPFEINNVVPPDETIKSTSTVKPTVAPTPTPSQVPTPAQTKEEFLATHGILSGDTNRNVVLMTYDDQGTYVQVEQILAAYRSHPKSKATFFFLGNKIEPSGKVVRAIINDGHLLGCHGWDHETPLSKKSDAAINQDFERCFEAINNVIPGYVFQFVRFPFGDSFQSERVLRIAARWGMQHVYWTMGSNGNTTDTYRIVTSQVKPGSIVLSHMFRKYDYEKAGMIVDRLIEMGYSLESIKTGRRRDDVYPS
jgi:peptidoglycan/xylan/chitin deacetylase (PgdA/CDA1 family)